MTRLESHFFHFDSIRARREIRHIVAPSRIRNRLVVDPGAGC